MQMHGYAMHFPPHLSAVLHRVSPGDEHDTLARMAPWGRLVRAGAEGRDEILVVLFEVVCGCCVVVEQRVELVQERLDIAVLEAGREGGRRVGK